MRTMKLRTLVTAMLVASAPLAPHAQSASTSSDMEVQTRAFNTTAENKGQTQVATKIASSFTRLAGSEENALRLVRALREGTAVTLTTTTTPATPGPLGPATPGPVGPATGTPPTTTTTTFTPPTGKMGWGNVFNSLALAQDSLARAGITNPTSAQLQAALMGGEVTGADGKTVALKGILQMRADGMGWGQIAQASGTKLGPVVSAIKSTRNKVAELPSTETGTTRTPPMATTNGSKGVTTAAGGASTMHGAKDSSPKGVVTAGGASAGAVTHGNSGNGGGKGLVTAAGGSAASVTHGNSGNAGGHGVVNAGGGNAASVTTASNAGGNAKGNAGGNGNGKGKGGG